MESPVTVVLLLAAIAGVVALEMKELKTSLVAIGAAIVLFAVGMLVVGAAEVGIAALVAAVVVLPLWRNAFARIGGRDEVAGLDRSGAGVASAVALVVFAVVLFVVLSRVAPGAPVAEDEVAGGQMGLVRELLVVCAALAGVWAMLRKTGRRDE
jgi:hypothetical protein